MTAIALMLAISFNAGAKTVTVVGEQSDFLYAGSPSTVTYSVATAGISNNLPGSVQWYSNAAGTTPTNAPSGVTATVSTGNATRTLTVKTGTNTPSGTYLFRVKIDGVQSNVGTLLLSVIIPPQKRVTIGTQSGTLSSGAASFAISTENVDKNAKASVEWFSNAAGTASTNALLGVTATVSTGSQTRILTVKPITVSGKSLSIPEGTYYFRVTLDGQKSSNVGKFVREAPKETPKEVSPSPAPSGQTKIDKNKLQHVQDLSPKPKLEYITPPIIAFNPHLYLFDVWRQTGWYAFTLTTISVGTGETGYSIQWYSDEAGTVPASKPANLVTKLSVGNATRTLELKSDDFRPIRYVDKNFYFRITIGNLQSSNIGVIYIPGEIT